MKNIAIIGNGYVGKAVTSFFKERHNIYIYDPAYENSASKEKINSECEYAFICVPTQPREDGSCDTSLVEEASSWISVKNIIIKSTVEPGTTEALCKKYNKKIIFSPEFAGENKYWSPYKFMTDMKECPYYIFGGDEDICENVINLYQEIAGPDKSYRKTKSRVAETVKYLKNSFYSVKVAFCNEVFDLCKSTDISYTEVRDLWLLDPRMNKSFTSVFPDNRGFGGKCFPKDSKAFVKYGKDNNVNLSILNQAIESNNQIRNK
jgi:UDPglucose 6-dehydrogenase